MPGLERNCPLRLACGVYREGNSDTREKKGTDAVYCMRQERTKVFREGRILGKESIRRTGRVNAQKTKE